VKVAGAKGSDRPSALEHDGQDRITERDAQDVAETPRPVNLRTHRHDLVLIVPHTHTRPVRVVMGGAARSYAYTGPLVAQVLHCVAHVRHGRSVAWAIQPSPMTHPRHTVAPHLSRSIPQRNAEPWRTATSMLYAMVYRNVPRL
jgi:hypothetical protein